MTFNVPAPVFLATQTLIIGDESTIPLTQALFSARLEIVLWTHVVLEVWAVFDTTSTLERLNLPRATLIKRQADDRHLEHLESVARSYAILNSGAKYVLAGRALTVRRISAALRVDGVRRYDICEHVQTGAKKALQRWSLIRRVRPFQLLSSDIARRL